MAQAVSRTPAALAGRDLSARQTIVVACAAMALVTVLDLADGRLGLLFSVGFVLIAATAPLSVDIRGLFQTGVLPPAMLIASLLVVSMFWPSAIHVEGLAADASTMGRFIAAIIDRGLTLVIGHGLAIVVIALRILTTPDR